MNTDIYLVSPCLLSLTSLPPSPFITHPKEPQTNYVMMSPTLTLTHLPEELLDRICYFSPTQSLHALAMVSRDIGRIATTHLYTSITLTRSSFKYLRPLALLLWTSPRHADLVKHISVSRAYGGNLVPWPDYPGRSAPDVCDGVDGSEVDGSLPELVKNMVGRYVKESERAEWAKSVVEGEDALKVASLLLRSLRNVKRMGFDGFELVDPGVGRRKR
jgi:hypothetical protein